MAGKIIPGSPGNAIQPRPNPPTFNPLKPIAPFGTRTGGPTGDFVSSVDSAGQSAADKLHPLKPRRTI